MAALVGVGRGALVGVCVLVGVVLAGALAVAVAAASAGDVGEADGAAAG